MIDAPTALEIFTVVIIDSGVLMDLRMFQTAQTAELYILNYANAPDEVKKRGGNPIFFKTIKQLAAWAEKNPYFSFHVIYNEFKIKL